MEVFYTELRIRSLGAFRQLPVTIDMVFGLLLGSIAIATAIAFDIGSEDIAGREVEAWVRNLRGEK